MSDGSGPSSHGSFAWWDLDTSSWRTFQVSLLEPGCPRYSETWPRAGMTRSGTASRRPQSVPLTSVTESSSWPTPTVGGNYNRAGASPKAGDGLSTAVARWPTPQAYSHGPDSNPPGITKLDIEVRGMYPTPAATSYGTNQGGAAGRVGKVRPSLETMAQHNLWPTPAAADSERSSETYMRGNPTLLGAVRMWPTPTAQDAKNDAGPSQWGRNSDPLNVAVKRWPTPKARDYRGASPAGQLRNSPDLPEQVGGQLNPMWVEWLMGFPAGWTDLEPSETR
jgi:hypothetical protein